MARSLAGGLAGSTEIPCGKLFSNEHESVAYESGFKKRFELGEGSGSNLRSKKKLGPLSAIWTWRPISRSSIEGGMPFDSPIDERSWSFIPASSEEGELSCNPPIVVATSSSD